MRPLEECSALDVDLFPAITAARYPASKMWMNHSFIRRFAPPTFPPGARAPLGRGIAGAFKGRSCQSGANQRDAVPQL
jgi:hypothetical protein